MISWASPLLVKDSCLSSGLWNDFWSISSESFHPSSDALSCFRSALVLQLAQLIRQHNVLLTFTIMACIVKWFDEKPSSPTVMGEKNNMSMTCSGIKLAKIYLHSNHKWKIILKFFIAYHNELISWALCSSGTTGMSTKFLE